MQAGQPQISWINSLRLLAMTGVVFLHVAADPFYEWGNIPMQKWWTANVLDSSVRWSVPVFVMITGALLLPRAENLITFYKKRFLHVLAPFLFWTFIYIGLELINYNGSGGGIKNLSWLWSCLWNGAAYHLWYVYMILGLYIFVPLIGAVIRRCSEPVILGILVVWLVILYINRNMALRFSGEYAGYLILGYYLANKNFENKKRIRLLAMLLIVCDITITVMGTYFISKELGAVSEWYYSFLTIHTCMAAAGVFLLVKHIREHTLSKPARLLNEYSYGIYLAHVMVLTYLAKAGINGNLLHPAFGTPLTTVLCLCISAGVIYILRKLPYGKYISG